jgi:hypothetical protein
MHLFKQQSVVGRVTDNIGSIVVFLYTLHSVLKLIKNFNIILMDNIDIDKLLEEINNAPKKVEGKVTRSITL